METWKAVPGASRYEVSDHGRVCSTRRSKPRILTPYRSPKGYLILQIVTDEGTRRGVRVHVLVLEAFVGPRPAGQQTRHLDGDPGNNHLSNLRWGTMSENAFDIVRHGRHNSARKTHCPQGHPYDEANTRLRPSGWRACRECARRDGAKHDALRRRRRAAA